MNRPYFVSSHAAIRYLQRVVGVKSMNVDAYSSDSAALSECERLYGVGDVRAWLEGVQGLRQAVDCGAVSYVRDGVRYIIKNGVVVTVKTVGMGHNRNRQNAFRKLQNEARL